MRTKERQALLRAWSQTHGRARPRYGPGPTAGSQPATRHKLLPRGAYTTTQTQCTDGTCTAALVRAKGETIELPPVVRLAR